LKPGIESCRTIHGFARIVILLFCITVPNTVWGNEQRLAILPFDLNAEKSLSFLKDGIQSMIISRLSWSNHVKIIEVGETQYTDWLKNATKDSLIQDVDDTLHADYILMGSMSVLNNRLSIDISVRDLRDKQPVKIFSRQNLEMNDVIPELDLMTKEINETVFGRKPPRDFTPSNTAESDQSIYAHPDRLLDNLHEKN